MNEKVKIVCTLGPASLKTEVLGPMMDAGLNVARLNFSHGDHDSHLKALELVRQVAKEKGCNVSIMLDTKGPEIRTTLTDGEVFLASESTVVLTPDDGGLCTAETVRLTHGTLAKECQPGQDVFIDDGTIHLEVTSIEGDNLICRVVVGGPLGNRKGVNLPGADISLPAMSEKDKSDILWGVEQNVDFVAISFVRSREDVLAVRRVIEGAGGDIKLIAKIESRQAVHRLEEIADVVDGMMIARGDLGVEIPTEDVPLVQKRIIDLCRQRGKPTIVATQMLDSMIRNPRPTRAEANDVSNGVLDGADAVMLSGESAAGKYPLLAVKTMSTIARRAEKELNRWGRSSVQETGDGVPEGIARAAVWMAESTGAKAILCLTTSGETARLVSKYRPSCQVLAFTPLAKTAREMSLLWGVESIVVELAKSGQQAIAGAIDAAKEAGLVSSGDLVVITAGFPMDTPGTTNTVQAQVVSRIVAQGLPILRGAVTGRVCRCESAADLERFQPGDVLLATETDKEFVTAMKRASAVVTSEGGLTSHAAIVSLEFGVPAVVGAKGAMDLHDGSVVTVDGASGLIYEGIVNLGKADK